MVSIQRYPIVSALLTVLAIVVAVCATVGPRQRPTANPSLFTPPISGSSPSAGCPIG